MSPGAKVSVACNSPLVRANRAELRPGSCACDVIAPNRDKLNAMKRKKHAKRAFARRRVAFSGGSELHTKADGRDARRTGRRDACPTSVMRVVSAIVRGRAVREDLVVNGVVGQNILARIRWIDD